MFSPEDGVKLIQAESDRLRSYLGKLSSEELEQPSACDDWTVADVVAHLIWFAEDDYGANIARGLRGDSSTPDNARPSDRIVPAMAGGVMAQTAIEVRRRLGDQLISAYDTTFAKFNQMLAGIGAQDWDKACFHPGGNRPVRDYVAGCVQEMVIHRWDICAGFETSPDLPDESMPFLLDRALKRALPWRVPFTSSFSTPLRYRFELTGAEAGVWDLVVENKRASLEPVGEAPVNVSLACGSDTFALLLYGRLTLQSAKAAGRLEVAGDEALILDFDHWIKGG